MEKNVAQNLLGHVSSWQAETIETLKCNNSDFFDMAWMFQGVFYKDCRHLYSSRSDYFKCLFLNDMRKGTEEFEGVKAYKVSDPMSKRHIFDMMRVFCHTGIVQVDKGEPILKTMERYSAFHYYSLRGGMDVIRQLVMDVINPSNAIQALEYAMNSVVCSGEDSSDRGLLSDISDYIAIYAFVVFKHKSFYALGFESIPGISQICARDDLNIREIDLLQCVFKLCEKRIHADKDGHDLRSTWELMTHNFSEPGSSLWSQLRLSSITMREFVKFIKENKDCFSSDNVVEIITFLYSCAEATGGDGANGEHVSVDPEHDVIGTQLSRKRKTFQAMSFYPRNLEFHGFASPQTDISYWDDSKIKLFVAFDFAKKETVTLPPVHFHNFFVHCTVYHADRSINVGVNIHGRTAASFSSPLSSSSSSSSPSPSVLLSPSSTAPTDVTITSSVVNFRHDRWRKKSVTASLVGGTAVKIPTILSWNTIGNNDTPGYLFDIDKYPEYCPKGSWILMSLCLEK
ncbi:unnamed protein product [Ectocarpus sp. 12 AP-2014]